MYKRCLICLTYVAVLIASVNWLEVLHAETLGSANDPTKPPTFHKKLEPAPKPPKLNPQDYQVTSILVSGQRKVAVINNQVVSVGDEVKAGEADKARVTGIKASEVTLSKARREFTVRLPSSRYIKSAADGQTRGLKDQP